MKTCIVGVGGAADIGILPWLGLIYGTVAGTAIGYLIWFSVLERLPAGSAGLGMLLVPVFGVISSAILLDERPTPADLVGFALILAAALLALRDPAQNA